MDPNQTNVNNTSENKTDTDANPVSETRPSANANEQTSASATTQPSSKPPVTTPSFDVMEQVNKLSERLGDIINKMGVDNFIYALGIIILFFSFFMTWFFEATIINGNVMYNYFSLFTGNTFFFGYIVFVLFAFLLALFLMEYYGKQFDKLPIIHTDMKSTKNILSIIMFVILIGIVITHLSFQPANISNTQVISNAGVQSGCYIGLLGALFVLVANIKNEFKF